MSRLLRQPGVRETWISLSLLAALAGVALGVFIKQFHYDASIYAPPLLPAQAAPAGFEPADWEAAGLSPLGPAEVFGPENLADKIDGRAELYLAAGFRSLEARRFAARGDTGAWFEAFVYDQGGLEGAFAVFSQQRRPEAEALDLTGLAYGAANAVFFTRGPYYVELIGASEDRALRERMLELARAWLARRAGLPDRPAELALFPAQGFRPGSAGLLVRDAFGWAGLDRVYTAEYDLAGRSLLAFFSRRADPAEAERLGTGYLAFLKENGFTEAQAGPEAAGLQVLSLLGAFEIVFSQGPFLAGVHQAESLPQALDLAARLRAGLAGVKP